MPPRVAGRHPCPRGSSRGGSVWRLAAPAAVGTACRPSPLHADGRRLAPPPLPTPHLSCVRRGGWKAVGRVRAARCCSMMVAPAGGTPRRAPPLWRAHCHGGRAPLPPRLARQPPPRLAGPPSPSRVCCFVPSLLSDTRPAFPPSAFPPPRLLPSAPRLPSSRRDLVVAPGADRDGGGSVAVCRACRPPRWPAEARPCRLAPVGGPAPVYPPAPVVEVTGVRWGAWGARGGDRWVLRRRAVTSTKHWRVT